MKKKNPLEALGEALKHIGKNMAVGGPMKNSPHRYGDCRMPGVPGVLYGPPGMPYGIKIRHKFISLESFGGDYSLIEEQLDALADEGWAVRHMGPYHLIMTKEIWPDEPPLPLDEPLKLVKN